MLARTDHVWTNAASQQGQRLIVVNAGSEGGLVSRAQLVYKASQTTGDYHSQMKGENFMKWIETQLLPNLDGPGAIVMDNASYHSVQTKDVQQQALSRTTLRYTH